MKTRILLFALLSLLWTVQASAQNETLDLQGKWRFAIDRAVLMKNAVAKGLAHQFQNRGLLSEQLA